MPAERKRKTNLPERQNFVCFVLPFRQLLFLCFIAVGNAALAYGYELKIDGVKILPFRHFAKKNYLSLFPPKKNRNFAHSSKLLQNQLKNESNFQIIKQATPVIYITTPPLTIFTTKRARRCIRARYTRTNHRRNGYRYVRRQTVWRSNQPARRIFNTRCSRWSMQHCRFDDRFQTSRSE